MLSSLYSCVCPKRNSSGPKLDLQGVSWWQKFHTTQNSCDVPKVPQMLTKRLNNWSYSWAGFTHNTFKCCCLEYEMRWNDRFWVSIMFVSRRYTVIIHQFDFPCVLKRESRNHCAGFQNLHFQYTFQGINIQCGKNMYVHVAAQWSTASSFRALKQLKRKADCWSKS